MAFLDQYKTDFIILQKARALFWFNILFIVLYSNISLIHLFFDPELQLLIGDVIGVILPIISLWFLRKGKLVEAGYIFILIFFLIASIQNPLGDILIQPDDLSHYRILETIFYGSIHLFIVYAIAVNIRQIIIGVVTMITLSLSHILVISSLVYSFQFTQETIGFMSTYLLLILALNIGFLFVHRANTSSYNMIKLQQKKLEEANSSLEEQVQERTQELEALNRKLYHLSIHDPLTAIPNRRFFEKEYERICAEVADSGERIAMLMIDIDCFKPYNDTYGHQKGDEVLIKVAQTLQENLDDENTFLARFGGEEFCVLLKNVTETFVYEKGEELRKAVEALEIEHDQSVVGPRVTISIGAAITAPAEDPCYSHLLKKADIALYAAKKLTKNCTMIYQKSKGISEILK